jgi:hypothetical protein
MRSGDGVQLAKAIRRARGAYFRAGESDENIVKRWRRFRQNNTRKQRYLWLVVYGDNP